MGGSDWRYVKAVDAGQWLSGGTPDTTVERYWGGEIPWITSSALTSFRIANSRRRVTQLGLKRGTRLVPGGTVLMVVRGMSLASEFRVGISKRPVAFGQDCKALRPSGDFVPEFLAYAFLGMARAVLAVVDVAGHGTRRLPMDSLLSLPIPCPPIAEQRRIADALADADGMIDALERMIAKKQAIKQGMMQQLLTGKTRLPGFTEPWTEASLGSVARVTMGQSPAGSSYNTDGRGVPLVQGNADIRDRSTFDRIWTTAPSKRCNKGDVLVTVRAPVGSTAVASKDCCLGRGVCALNADGDNRFLFHALVYAEPKWILFEQGSTFTAVNSNEVRSFEVAWPTDQVERAAIANALDNADGELAALRARLIKARSVRAGMMQELLTGRTRLSERDAG